jgi:hypothetical protein
MDSRSVEEGRKQPSPSQPKTAIKTAMREEEMPTRTPPERDTTPKRKETSITHSNHKQPSPVVQKDLPPKKPTVVVSPPPEKSSIGHTRTVKFQEPPVNKLEVETKEASI